MSQRGVPGNSVARGRTQTDSLGSICPIFCGPAVGSDGAPSWRAGFDSEAGAEGSAEEEDAGGEAAAVELSLLDGWTAARRRET